MQHRGRQGGTSYKLIPSIHFYLTFQRHPPLLPIRCATITGSRSPWPTTPWSSTFSSASTALRLRRPASTSTGRCVSAAPDPLTTKRSPPGPAPPRRSHGAAPRQQAAATSMATRSPNHPRPQDLRFATLSLSLSLTLTHPACLTHSFHVSSRLSKTPNT